MNSKQWIHSRTIGFNKKAFFPFPFLFNSIFVCIPADSYASGMGKIREQCLFACKIRYDQDKM